MTVGRLVLVFVGILSLVCGENLFYIYEWPDYFSDVWPPQGSALVNDTPYSHSFRSNYSGVGDILNPDLGYFSTWQFALYKLTLARLRVSELRTMDPAKATSFLVPFDMGCHSFVDHRTGKARVASPHGWRATEYLKETIAKDRQVYWKNGGHDHFVIYSITSYQISGIGSKVFMTETCENCSVITIETTPTFTARKYYSGKSRKWWFAVPYPSSFHWWEGIKTPPWILNPESDPKRSILAIFIGSQKTQSPDSNKLRRKLHTDCLAEPELCTWKDTSHSCNGLVNQSDHMLLYRQSQFCLTPPGDSLTRKSLFDALLTGCIPVIFAKATINQYTWHIPADQIEQISIYIPLQTVTQGVNFMSVLKAITPEKITSMQKAIEKIAPSLQYSVVPMKYQEQQRYLPIAEANTLNDIAHQDNNDHLKFHVNKRDIISKESPLSQTTLTIKPIIWKGPPQPDAVDIIISRILNRTTIEPINGFTPKDFARLTEIRDNAKLWDPAYSGLIAHADKPKWSKGGGR